MILERLAEGALNLTAIGLLAPHLTPQNHVKVLDAARHKSKRDVEQLVARLHPRPDASAVVRRLPAPKVVPVTQDERRDETSNVMPPGIPVMPPRPVEVKPVAPERYKIQFTVGRETHEKLRRAQDLLRHSIPNGDPAAIFDRALTLLLNELSKVK